MSQAQSTISSKNQVVVPATIRRDLNLQAGDTIIWQTVRVGQQKRILASPRPKNWAKYMRGLGKHVWAGVDINQYIRDLRQEWHTPN